MQNRKEWLDQDAGTYELPDGWEPLALGEHLRRWSEQYGGSVALVEGGNRVTYRELDRRADELAAGFVHLSIRKGDHVVVQLPNRISFVAACFALFRIGALPILALPAHREKELDAIFQAAKPVAYIAPDVFQGFDYRPMAERLASSHPSVKLLITDGESERGVRLADIGMPPIELAAPSHRDIALLLLSGGTTGVPKLIPRTHADYAYNAKAAAARSGLNRQSVYLAVLPVAHNFPLCCPGILGTLSVGGRAVLSASTSCDEAFPLIEKEKVTITALVPALVGLWLETLAWDASSDISSLEVLQVGGAMLDPQVARRIMPEMKCRLQQVFGMAEGLICATSLDDPEPVVHSCQGRPISEGDEIRIVDEDGNDVPTGEYGELLTRGPYTIKGYYRAPEQNRKAFTPDGFYRSGDRARWTAEGNIQIGGRFKEQINRAGEKISPAEVEAYLCAHPDIREAAVVGVPDEQLGERSCAYLMTDNKAVTLADIHRYLQDQGVARYKMPDLIRPIDRWPLTSVGKIDRAKLKAMAKEGDRTDGDSRQDAYFEQTIGFAGDAHSAAAQVIESGLFETYLLYENGDELSLGLGVHSLITVEPETTTLLTGGETLTMPTRDVGENVERAFSAVPLERWRAYGIASFGLARFQHRLPLLHEDPHLLKLFVPEAEVRFKAGSVLLRALNKKRMDEMSRLLEQLADGDKEKQCMPEPPDIHTHDSVAYMRSVETAVREIRQRRYHKVIVSRQIPLGQKLDMTASYLAGRRANTPARSFLLKLDGLQAAGFSPETVAEVDSDGWVSTFPLAGTRSTGSSGEEEAGLREELLSDPKEIAEHAVSVKLAFEEMLQVCEAESVHVNDFMSVARRGTVQHIASRLRGKLKPGCNAWHAFLALFPGITASGIPKKPSIEAIGRIESAPRHLYSGCVMTCDNDGALDAALVLRSLFQNEDGAWLQAGAGIVGMSVPARELEETREKLSSVASNLVRKESESWTIH